MYHNLKVTTSFVSIFNDPLFSSLPPFCNLHKNLMKSSVIGKVISKPQQYFYVTQFLLGVHFFQLVSCWKQLLKFDFSKAKSQRKILKTNII